MATLSGLFTFPIAHRLSDIMECNEVNLSLVQLIVVTVVVCVLLWLVEAYLPMDAGIKRIIKAVAVLEIHILINAQVHKKPNTMRRLLCPPTMRINPAVTDLFGFRYEDFRLENYVADATIRAPIAV